MSTIRVRFGCLLFRTAACLSGPQCLQLEYVLGACKAAPPAVLLQIHPAQRGESSEQLLSSCNVIPTLIEFSISDTPLQTNESNDM